MSTLISAPPAPSSVPTTSLAPCAQSTSTVAPLPKVVPPGREDDMSMGSCPTTLTPFLAAIPPQGMCTSADFLKSFLQGSNQAEASLKLWLGKAAYRKIPLRHFITAVRTAEQTALLSNVAFLNFTHSFLSYISTAPCPSEEVAGLGVGYSSLHMDFSLLLVPHSHCLYP
jgi:hypothetical protein